MVLLWHSYSAIHQIWLPIIMSVKCPNNNVKSEFILEFIYELNTGNLISYFTSTIRVVSDFWNENSRTNSIIFQEHINTFQEHEWRWKYHNNITIHLKNFLKKLNLIITNDKSHEIQISTRTKLRKS